MTLLKSDGDQGRKAFLDQVQVIRSREHMPTLREDSRRHEHQTNGAAESANHQIARHASLILL